MNKYRVVVWTLVASLLLATAGCEQAAEEATPPPPKLVKAIKVADASGLTEHHAFLSPPIRPTAADETLHAQAALLAAVRATAANGRSP